MYGDAGYAERSTYTRGGTKKKGQLTERDEKQFTGRNCNDSQVWERHVIRSTANKHAIVCMLILFASSIITK